MTAFGGKIQIGQHTESGQKNRLYAFIMVFIASVLAAALLSGCGEIEVIPDDEGGSDDKILLEEVPVWGGEPYAVINGNVPEFTKSEIRSAEKAVRGGERYELLTELDRLDRCGSVTAVVSTATMPDGERGSIGMIKPSGWQLDKYEFIDNGGYLYNRCHLVGWQLTGLNDEERNLITGTRYMNVEGMLPFENKVAGFVRGEGGPQSEGSESGGEGLSNGVGAYVLYRATPDFRGKELVARGVQIEAYSLEDGGEGLSFNVYCYNVQPGVSIDYRNGKNRPDPETMPDGVKEESITEEGSGIGGAETQKGTESGGAEKNNEYPPLEIPEGVTYILNTNTMRFHRLDCKGARTIREHNREWFYGSRKEAIRAGYAPCGMCEP